MLQTFKVENVKCGGCAKTLKTKLLHRFGEVEVDLEKTPREISLDIDESDIKALEEALKSIGYPLTTTQLTTFEQGSTKVMSFVSCALGKV